MRISSDLGTVDVIADAETFGSPTGTVRARFGDVSISQDGQVIAFWAYVPGALGRNLGADPIASLSSDPFSPMLFAIDEATGQTIRVTGSERDAFLDPGERWETTSEGLIIDVTSENTFLGGLAGVVVAPEIVPSFAEGRGVLGRLSADWFVYRNRLVGRGRYFRSVK